MKEQSWHRGVSVAYRGFPQACGVGGPRWHRQEPAAPPAHLGTEPAPQGTAPPPAGPGASENTEVPLRG